jgi:uncharacterized protein (TIGR02246 family)
MVVLCWLLCLAGVSVAQRAPKKQPSPVPPEQQVKQTVDRFIQAWAANDTDSVRRACAEEVLMTELGRQNRGLQAVLDYLKVNFENFPKMEFQLGPVEARVVGSMAWAHADSRAALITSHGTKLNLAGYTSYVLERRRDGWKIVLMDFDLQPVQTAGGESPPPESPGVEGAWLLELSKNLNTSKPQQQAAMMILTKTRFCMFAAAPDRRQLKDKRLSDYSKKELLEIMREVEPSSGSYRLEGNKLILKPTLTLLPSQTGEEVMLENVRVTPDRLSYEMMTPDGRVQRVWRRLE